MLTKGKLIAEVTNEKTFQILSFVFFFGCSAVLSLIIIGYSRIPNEISMQNFDTMSSGNTYVCQSLTKGGVLCLQALNDFDILVLKIMTFHGKI